MQEDTPPARPAKRAARARVNVHVEDFGLEGMDDFQEPDFMHAEHAQADAFELPPELQDLQAGHSAAAEDCEEDVFEFGGDLGESAYFSLGPPAGEPMRDEPEPEAADCTLAPKEQETKDVPATAPPPLKKRCTEDRRPMAVASDEAAAPGTHWVAASLSGLEERLEILGELPRFVAVGTGRLEHTCLRAEATVCFWPGTLKWEVHGKHGYRVEQDLLEPPAAQEEPQSPKAQPQPQPQPQSQPLQSIGLDEVVAVEFVDVPQPPVQQALPLPPPQPRVDTRRRLRRKTAPEATFWADEPSLRGACGTNLQDSAAKRMKTCSSGTATSPSELAASLPLASSAASASSSTGGAPACSTQQAPASASHVALACMPAACVGGSPCEDTRGCPGSAVAATSVLAPRSVEGGGGTGPCETDSPEVTGAGGKGSARACEAREVGRTVSPLAQCPRQPDGPPIKRIGRSSPERPQL